MRAEHLWQIRPPRAQARTEPPPRPLPPAAAQVAAINGHAFGAGVFLALACDWRLMRTERGFLNFPELNLGMRLSKAFAARPAPSHD